MEINELLEKALRDKIIKSMTEFFKDYHPLKGSYEDFKHQYEYNECQLIKFVYNSDTGNVINTTIRKGRIEYIDNYFNEVSVNDYEDEYPSESVNYIVLYNNLRDADSFLSKDYHNYIFNANSLISKRIRKRAELVENKLQEELPEMNRIKGILNEIIK